MFEHVHVVYLAGQLSGRGDDHRSEAQVGRLLQVGEQRETESQSLPRSCGCTGQQLPTLIQESDTQQILTKPLSARRLPKTARVSVLTCIMSGIACICTGVGEFSPASLRFWMTRGLRRYSDYSSSNVHTGSGTSEPCTFMRC